MSPSALFLEVKKGLSMGVWSRLALCTEEFLPLKLIGLSGDQSFDIISFILW